MSRYIPVLPEKWAKMVRCWAENVRLETEVAQLKTELERVRLEQKMNAVPVEAKLLDRIAKLQAEVERLTKAGDAMASGLQGMAGERAKALADEWNEAKGVNP